MIVHNINNLPTIPIADLLPTQGDLKDLSEYAKFVNDNELPDNWEELTPEIAGV